MLGRRDLVVGCGDRDADGLEMFDRAPAEI
jgi:hypothetical protein